MVRFYSRDEKVLHLREFIDALEALLLICVQNWQRRHCGTLARLEHMHFSFAVHMSRHLVIGVAALVVLALRGSPAEAQRIAPVGLVVQAARSLPSIDIGKPALRVSQESAGGSDRRRHAVVGGIVGMSVGVALGYSLARVGHRAYCEGVAQCAEYPRRGIAAATWTGGVIGVAIGATIGWTRG